MHSEHETYVLQNRVLDPQFKASEERREHKRRRDIMGQHAQGANGADMRA
jgi:hypothetical protein